MNWKHEQNTTHPVDIYLLKVNNANISKVNNEGTRTTRRRSGVFIVNFGHITRLVPLFLLLTLSM